MAAFQLNTLNSFRVANTIYETFPRGHKSFDVKKLQSESDCVKIKIIRSSIDDNLREKNLSIVNLYD